MGVAARKIPARSADISMNRVSPNKRMLANPVSDIGQGGDRATGTSTLSTGSQRRNFAIGKQPVKRRHRAGRRRQL